MTAQEQQMIDGLIDRIRNTRLTDRDPEAAAHLQQGLGGNPDAIYILAQTVLVQQQAMLQAQSQLQAANTELTRLRESAGHPPQQAPGSWLDRFFGTSSAAANQPPQPQSYPSASTAAPQQTYGAPIYAPQPAYGQQPYPPQAYPPQGYPQPGYAAYGQPAGGSFLRNAAQTAAGVAAGALLFEGVESMFGGHGGGFGGGGYGHEGGTTIINNYEDRPEGDHHAATGSDGSFYNPSNDASRDLSGAPDSSSQGLSPDIEDRRDFASGGDNSGNDTADNFAADDSTDSGDSFSDDGGSFDDSSSSDGGSL